MSTKDNSFFTTARNFPYRIENVVCHLFRTANLVDNGTIEGQIGEGCGLGIFVGDHSEVPVGAGQV